jgi:hypothetical protein
MGPVTLTFVAKSSSRLIAAVLSFVLVAGLVIAGVALSRNSGDDSDSDLAQEPVADLDQRVSGSLAWAGDQLFSYGGSVDGAFDRGEIAWSNEAALIDPSSGQSTILPAPPFEGALVYGGAAAAAGDHLVLVGGLCTAVDGYEDGPCPPTTFVAASFDRAEEAWEPVEMPDGLRDARGTAYTIGSTSDGRVVFQVDEFADGRGAPAGTFWTFSPASGEWAEIPAPPSDEVGACLAGDQLVVSDSSFRYGDEVLPADPAASGESGTYRYTSSDGTIDPRVVILDLSSGDAAWVETPVAEDFFIESDSGDLKIECTEDQVLLHNSGRDARIHPAAADQAGEPWERTPDAPSGAVFPAVLAVGDVFVFLPPAIEGPPGDVDAQIFDPASGSWSTAPELPQASGVMLATDDGIVGISEGSTGAEETVPASLVFVQIAEG